MENEMVARKEDRSEKKKKKDRRASAKCRGSGRREGLSSKVN
jgi:hypothetical protein